MASRDALYITEPHNSLTHIFKILTRVGHHQITWIHTSQFISVFRSQIGGRTLRLNAILREDMTIVNSRNTLIDK